MATYNLMAGLIAWAAETFDTPQEAVGSAAMHMAEMGTYQMGYDTDPAPLVPQVLCR